MNGEQEAVDAIVEAVHNLANEGSDLESIDDLMSELTRIAPQVVDQLHSSTFLAALVRGCTPTGCYIDRVEAPYPLIDELSQYVDELFGPERANEIRATNKLAPEEKALLLKRWANACLDDGHGMDFWITELRATDERSAWIAIYYDDDEGFAFWLAATARRELVRWLTIAGYVDRPLSID